MNKINWDRVSNRMDVIGCIVASTLIVFYVFSMPFLVLMMSEIGSLYIVKVFVLVTGMTSLFIGVYTFLRRQTRSFERSQRRKEDRKKRKKARQKTRDTYRQTNIEEILSVGSMPEHTCEQCGKAVDIENRIHYTDIEDKLLFCSKKCARIYFTNYYQLPLLKDDDLKDADTFIVTVDIPAIKKDAQSFKGDVKE